MRARSLPAPVRARRRSLANHRDRPARIAPEPLRGFGRKCEHAVSPIGEQAVEPASDSVERRAQGCGRIAREFEPEERVRDVEHGQGRHGAYTQGGQRGLGIMRDGDVEWARALRPRERHGERGIRERLAGARAGAHAARCERAGDTHERNLGRRRPAAAAITK